MYLSKPKMKSGQCIKRVFGLCGGLMMSTNTFVKAITVICVKWFPRNQNKHLLPYLKRIPIRVDIRKCFHLVSAVWFSYVVIIWFKCIVRSDYFEMELIFCKITILIKRCMRCSLHIHHIIILICQIVDYI